MNANHHYYALVMLRAASPSFITSLVKAVGLKMREHFCAVFRETHSL